LYLGADGAGGPRHDYFPIAIGAENALDPNDRDLTAVRNKVSAEHRAHFDELYQEAFSTYYMRDKRDLFANSWASGLVRNALLEIGRRLVKKKLIHQHDHSIEANTKDIVALLKDGKQSVTADELAERAKFRATHTWVDVPLWIGLAPGSSPPGPPSADLFPVACRRAIKSVDVIMGRIFGTDSRIVTSRNAVRGLSASLPKKYEGIARIVNGPPDFHKVNTGDVIVCQTSGASFNVVVQRAGAIIADQGSYLSHPAVIARELGIPGIIGAANATRVIGDGDRVFVDGSTGLVTVKSRAK